MSAQDNPNITFVLYEGKHDAAILTRLLRENDHSNFTDKKISEFPPALQGFLKGKISDFTYEDEVNMYQRPQLPNAICKSKEEDKWYIFYEMGGDSQVEYIKALVSSLATKDSEFDSEEQFETQQAYSLALFYDADKDVKKRKETFEKDYSELLPNFCNLITESDEQSNIISSASETDGFLKIGLFIYGAADGTGTLEDILIPVMKKNKESNFDDADKYLETYMSDAAKQSGSKKGKALIGVVGQPKHQGKANQVIITDSPFITKAKLNANPTFQEILTFLKSF